MTNNRRELLGRNFPRTLPITSKKRNCDTTDTIL